MLKAISPLDGRYEEKLQILKDYFSEFALIRYRLHVEIEYFIYLTDSIPINKKLTDTEKKQLRNLYHEFNLDEADRIKAIEHTTKHDVKAVEYYLKEQLVKIGLNEFQEYIHFALTSQDINNTAIPLLLRDFSIQNLLPLLSRVLNKINELGMEWKQVAMISKTHGQSATPTTVGKEFLVFYERLNNQILSFQNIQYSVKFGGATGNFNAHHAAFPQIGWKDWSNQFMHQVFHIRRQQYTTQIAHYDEIAEWCHQLIRINTILIDFCRDIWTYISMDYFKQKSIAGEVGSSTMPHKINPIDFENAEGNFGLSTAIAAHLAEKLPISRLQRDLTDSTVLRNIGVPIGHSFLALLSIENGLSKLILNESKLKEDLDDNWVLLSEAIQTILRREQFENPYELLKDLTRGKSKITKDELHAQIDQMNLSESLKEELKSLRPETYIGAPI